MSRPLQCPPSCQSLHKRLLIPSLTSGVCSNATLSDKPTLLPAPLFYFTLWWWWWFSHLSHVFATPWTSLRGSSVHGISQARILGWVATSFWGSSWSRDWTHISCVSCFGRRILYQLSHQGNSDLIFLHWIVRAGTLYYSLFQFSSVTQSCPTLCDPMNRSTPGLPVHHQLPEFTIYSSTTRIVPSSNLKSYVSISLNEDQRVAWGPFWGRWCAQLRIGFYSLGKRDLCFWCSLEWILIFVSPYIDLWLQSDWTVFQILKPTVFLPSDS